MPLVVQPVSLDEIACFTKLYSKVFTMYQVDRALYMYGSTPENEIVNIRNEEEKFQHKRNVHYLCVRDVQSDLHSKSSPMVATAIWRLEDEETFHDQSRIGEEQLPHSRPECVSRFFGGMASMRKEIMGPKKYWHLEVLTTDPEHERRGAGSLLVRWGTDCADKAGIETFVNASDIGFPLYARLGFEAKMADLFDLRPYGVDGTHRTTAMVRPTQIISNIPPSIHPSKEPVGSLTST